MRKPLLLALAGWLIVAGLSFVFLDPVLAAFIAIFGAAIAGLVPLAATWNEASTYEERELRRARRRAVKRDRDKAARAADRAKLAARRARKAS